ncbi:hypothetical protein HK097_003251 [Rhizophlyctis rosea]|uniref:Transmembrane protein 198 n=1 Tax=Rhizophlyctis rosea TaxID=64517 RepID=A0AAD5SF02_9FUNG|nr:hypothetical protein HK097_003251 [Rhizophlyctis rosea]
MYLSWNSSTSFKPTQWFNTIAQLLMVFMIGLVNAAPIDQSIDNGITSTSSGPLTVQAIILGVLCLLVGAVFLFAGIRLFPIVTAIAGFIFFSIIGYIILVQLAPEGGYRDNDTVLLAGSLAIGILGLFLGLCLWQLGVAFIGALAGFALANWILSLRDGGLIRSEAGRIILIVALVVVGIILIFMFETPVLIITTSLVGAYLICFGVDQFTRTGFNLSSYYLLTNRRNSLELTGPIIGFLVAFIVLAIIGIAVQFRMNRGVKHSHRDRHWRGRRVGTKSKFNW